MYGDRHFGTTLNKYGVPRQTFMKSLNVKFHGKSSSGSRANTCGQMDKTKITDAFRHYRNTARSCTYMRRLTTGIRSEKRVVR
jgi:hypothetical protein